MWHVFSPTAVGEQVDHKSRQTKLSLTSKWFYVSGYSDSVCMSFGLNRSTYFIWVSNNADLSQRADSALRTMPSFVRGLFLYFSPAPGKFESAPSFESSEVDVIVMFWTLAIRNKRGVHDNKTSLGYDFFCPHRKLWLTLNREWIHQTVKNSVLGRRGDAVVEVGVLRDLARAQHFFSSVLIRPSLSCWLRGWFCCEIMSLIKRSSTHEKAYEIKPRSVGGPPSSLKAPFLPPPRFSPLSQD